jgi:dTDP-4-dehydrorhamnose 3,5-epimerase-like enzyme
VQLDATAAIDGVKQLKVPGRTYHDAPPVSYRNLRACIVTPPSKKWVSEIAKSHADSIEYRDWVVDVVSNEDYFKPSTRALVVCKHALRGLRTSDDKEGLRFLPNWRRDPNPKTGINEDDEKWQALQQDPNGFHWDLGPPATRRGRNDSGRVLRVAGRL